MLIRPLLKKDIKSCIALSVQEHETYWNTSDFLEALNNENALFLVVEVKKKIVGFINGFIVPTKKDEAMIHESRIDIHYRGRKIGTALVDHFCQAAFQKNVVSITPPTSSVTKALP